MVDVLRELLAGHRGRSLDVASAYFTVGGFGLLRDGLVELGNLRLLLGAEPESGEQVGLRPDAAVVRGQLRRDLEALPFAEETLQLVEELIAYLRRQSVQVRLHQEGFLHAKAWIFYSDRPGQQELFDRFRPVLAIVGSSNFTIPGLTSNRELNLAHKVLLDPEEVYDREAQEAVRWLADSRASEAIQAENRQLLKSEVGARAIIDLERWFEGQWQAGGDFKDDLIELLDASKFGQKEYTPWEVYLKALYEYFKDDLAEVSLGPTRSAVDLAEFQEDAVKKARAILRRYDGVLVADSVGLGKTWIGKKLLEDFAYHLRQKALVVCPAALRDSIWEPELQSATIAAAVLSQEELGQADFDPEPWGDTDVVLVDESHNFRNPNSQRYQALERILQANRGRGGSGSRKKVILLTATPISNDLFDLYNQLQLVTGGDRSYFAAAGIGDLYRYFLHARRAARARGALELFNLLEEVVIRRTRPFIRQAYPEATIRGERIHFPERRLRAVRYDLEAVYAGIYEQVVTGIDRLKLAPYNLEAYKKAGVAVDEFEAGRETALVGIFKSRYLKRFESSVHAFRISVRRALSFLKTFESYILDGTVLASSDFHKALKLLSREGDDEDDGPRSLADDIEANEEARELLGSLETVNPGDYDLRRLHEAVQHDLDGLGEIWQRVKDLRADRDAKLGGLKDLLRGELRGKKVLLFSYFRDTARYLYQHLGHPENPAALAFCEELGGARVRRLDSGSDARERARIVQGFAPRANGRLEWQGTDREIDILISTDVLSEGQNLQDCGVLVNYDLHWNPTRMVQRAGRIDRIGSPFDELLIFNMFPDEGLESLLRLVQRLSDRIDAIDRSGFLDASVLGEVVHPQNFNTLRRIAAEDESVLDEEEQLSDLASSEHLQRQLQAYLAAGGREHLATLPDGIHSGLARRGARGIFFYFQGRPAGQSSSHYWRYCDLHTGRIVDNRYTIAQLINCSPDTPRVVDHDLLGSVFDLQQKVVEDILEAVRAQQAFETAPRALDPIQQTASTLLQSLIHEAGLPRQRVVDAIQFLRHPLRKTALRDLRAAVAKQGDRRELLATVEQLSAAIGDSALSSRNGSGRAEELRKEDLHLICFEVLSD